MLPDKSKVIAFIPGKTASIGLPGKMFKKIGQHSLLEWTLLAATQSKYIDEIVVSAIDPLVFEVFNKFASEHTEKVFRAIERPAELCSATSKTEQAISHLFNNYPYYSDFSYLVMLQATSPARRNGLIDKCFDKLIDTNADSLLTVTASTPFFWKKTGVGHAYTPTYDVLNRPMRQELFDRDYYYHDNGNVYITRVEKYLESRCRVSGTVEIYPTDKFESLQIDNAEDLIMMQSLHDYYGSCL